MTRCMFIWTENLELSPGGANVCMSVCPNRRRRRRSVGLSPFYADQTHTHKQHLPQVRKCKELSAARSGTCHYTLLTDYSIYRDMLSFQFGNQLPPRQFEECYSCFSMAMSGREDLESGDKILLPQSALATLARMNVDYPMLFQLSNPSMGRRTHCGVCEFTADEGRCSIPFWMMQNLMLAEGSLLAVKNVSLPKATFVKFRPQSVDFLDISNPRVVLENNLRKYTCATTGDQIVINYLGKNIYLDIVEVRPAGAASIVETDMEVDFDAPVGYTPPAPPDAAAMAKSAAGASAPRELQKARRVDESAAEEDDAKFKPFAGNAKRLDGKSVSTPSSASNESKPTSSAGSSSAPPPANGCSAIAAATTAPPARQSLVGNKYSKKKTAVSAFSGKAHKLSG